MKKVYIRFLSICLVLVTMFSMVSMVFAVESAVGGQSANNRIKTYINLAKGESVVNADLTNLTADQIRFLGVWLSNFYVPFGTELGGTDDRFTEKNKEDMKNALCNNLNFSEEMATVLIEEILGRARSSKKDLTYRFSTDPWYEGYKEEHCTKGPYSAIKMEENFNYYDFFRFMTGGYRDVFKSEMAFFNSSFAEYYVSFAGRQFASILPFDGRNATEDIFTKWYREKIKDNDSHWAWNATGGEDMCWEESANTGLPGARGMVTNIDYIAESHGLTINQRAFVDDVQENGGAQKVADLRSEGFTKGNTIFLLKGFYGKKWTNAVEYTYTSCVYMYDIDADVCRRAGKSSVSEIDDNTYYAKLAEALEYQAANEPRIQGGSTSYSGSERITDTYRICFSSGIDETSRFGMNAFEEAKFWRAAYVRENGANDYKTIFIGYEDNGRFIPVADCSMQLGEFTPSQYQFMKCLEAVDFKKGYGFSLMDFNKDDEENNNIEGALALFGRTWETLTRREQEQVYNLSTFASRMAVDCYGDIIVMGKVHQYIAMPGCVNPYMWQPVNKEGEDVSYNGAFINMVNARNIAQSEENYYADSGQINDFIYGTVNSSSSAGRIVDSPFKSLTSEFYTPDSASTPVKADARISLQTWRDMIDGLMISSQYSYDDQYEWHKHGWEFAAVWTRGSDAFSKFEDESGSFINQILDWSESSTRDAVMWTQWYHAQLTGGGSSLSAPHDEAREGGQGLDLYFLNDEDDYFYVWIDTVTTGTSCTRSERLNCLNNSGKHGRTTNYNNLDVIEDRGQSILTGFVFMDTLGTYNDGTEEFNLFNVASFLDSNLKSAAQQYVGTVDGNGFGNALNNIVSGEMMFPSSNPALYSSLYVTYCFAGLYEEENKKDTIGRLGYRMAVEDFPAVPAEALDVSVEALELPDYELENIKHWTYYLLHPTDGFRYVRTLISNKLNRLLLGWHSDMVGTNGVGATTGTTRYRSNIGYVSMPDLSELNWTAKLVGFYNKCIPFIIIVIIVLMLLAFITGALSLQHAFFAAVLFSAFLLLPTTLLNGAVQYSNLISQRIYGDKFIYWAMVQQETYAQAIDEAANMQGSSGDSTYENYLRTLYGQNQRVYSNQGQESIILKWQAPKKMASVMLSQNDADIVANLGSMRSMLMGMLGNAYSGQSYLDGDDSVYMYRSYLDISNFSRYVFRGIRDGRKPSYSRNLSRSTFLDWQDNLNYDQSYIDFITDNWTESAFTGGGYASKGAYVYDLQAREYDYNNFNGRYNSAGGYTGVATDSSIYKITPIQSKIINDALGYKNHLAEMSSTSDLIDLNRDLFNFGIPMFTNNSTSFSPEWFISTAGIPTEVSQRTAQDQRRANAITTSVNRYTAEDFSSLAAFSLYSENVFYYFSWGMYDWGGLNCDSSLTSGNFKDMILGREDGGFFYSKGSTTYNAVPSNELKDFMDMRSLFTYIIPYMKNCNDLVREWDDTYGIFIYDGVPTEEGLMEEMTTPELKQKYWHNLNVARLYGLYCPWVDLMYDCSYADSETITVLGQHYTIEDPLNPASYPVDRPMIFSRAEMVDMGLGEGDLTKAERLILKCNDQMQERVYDMLNYYNFSDITLNTATAMQCAFVFNRVFSEPSILGDNKNIYPQSFDLPNFSYDAFLRMILANTTNENLLETAAEAETVNGVMTGDFYERIVGRSSLTTVLVMLILDFLSIYVIPAFKIFFLIAAFLSSIAIVFVSVCKIEENAKFLRKVGSEFLMPLLQFFATTVGFSVLISLFMGTGNNAVTQTDQISISFGDPVIVMLIMIAIDVAVIIIYWKIIKKVLSSMRVNFKMMGNFTAGVVGGAAAMALGAVSAAATSARNAGNSAVNTARYHHRNKLISNGQGGAGGQALDPGQQGTGIESPRATQRASGNSGGSSDSSDSDGSEKSRRSSTSADTVRQNEPSSKTAEEQKKATKDIDAKAEAGSEKLKNNGGSSAEPKKSGDNREVSNGRNGSEGSSNRGSRRSPGANGHGVNGGLPNRRGGSQESRSSSNAKGSGSGSNFSGKAERGGSQSRNGGSQSRGNGTGSQRRSNNTKVAKGTVKSGGSSRNSGNKYTNNTPAGRNKPTIASGSSRRGSSQRINNTHRNSTQRTNPTRRQTYTRSSSNNVKSSSKPRNK